MAKNKKIIVQGSQIRVALGPGNDDYISLTDMAKKFGDDVLVYQWMRNRNTVEFLGIWEQIHNPAFKGPEFETFKKQAGMNNFSLTPQKWAKATSAVGIVSKAGRYGGGTYAHKAVCEFAGLRGGDGVWGERCEGWGARDGGALKRGDSVK